MPLTADFPGQYYPPSTIVSFPTEKGTLEGEVRKLNKTNARVIVGSNKTIWKVPYSILKIKKQSIQPEITLQEVEDFAYQKLMEYELLDWHFGFDLAQNRGGVCKSRSKVITLSVTYCLKASREEVLDTVLHEIAHAIVGPKHQHDKVWKEAALRIGCNGEVCHSVNHGLDKWEGSCPCGQTWKRKKLQKRVRNGTCPKCNAKITWQEII